ncbi:hypothetical protein [Nocardia sp. NPDC004123]
MADIAAGRIDAFWLNGIDDTNLLAGAPVARPRSLIAGKPTKITWSANWDDNLGGAPEYGRADPMRKGIEDRVRFV